MGYIHSCKIPALLELFSHNEKNTINEIASIISPERPEIVSSHTGFTNYYNAYRNQIPDWTERHSEFLIPILENIFRGEDEAIILKDLAVIDTFKKILKPNQ